MYNTLGVHPLCEHCALIRDYITHYIEICNLNGEKENLILCHKFPEITRRNAWENQLPQLTIAKWACIIKTSGNLKKKIIWLLLTVHCDTCLIHRARINQQIVRRFCGFVHAREPMRRRRKNDQNNFRIARQYNGQNSHMVCRTPRVTRKALLYIMCISCWLL